jgi:integrative and conjugative element protein (TIGR02256 family)
LNSQIYWSSDHGYSCCLAQTVYSRMTSLCARAWPHETGGILIGYYTTDQICAVITRVIMAPKDSQSGPSWFYRGVDGLQRRLHSLWQQKQYYLGEWHFHPGGQPIPSSVDVQQMYAIGASETYSCPEPLLIILAGSPLTGWNLRIFVFPRDKEHIALSRPSTD